MQDCFTIVLAASNHMSDSAYASQMIPVRGKPALAWVLESCRSGKSFVVLDKSNVSTIKYISNCYPDTEIVLVDPLQYSDFSILSSLLSGLNQITSTNKIIRVVLGDTLCDLSDIQNDVNLILTSDDFSDSTRWCLVQSDANGYVQQFFDKMNVNNDGKSAIIGVYQFTDYKCLLSCVIDSINAGEHNLSNVLIRYNKIHKIKTVNRKQWFDLGHKAGIINAQNYLFNSRSFNSLRADPVLGIMTKVSPKKQKLYDEWIWCKNLPEKLQILCPRPIKFYQDDNNAFMTMEMYGYPALSELFILGNLSLEEWKLILERLFLVHHEMEEFPGILDMSNFIDLYKDKTGKRFDELLEQNDYWKSIWAMEELVINGRKYKNIRTLAGSISNSIDSLLKNTTVTVMHGDYCFSNILFDTNSFICRLIDPRGRLKEQTIYGDPRYDIAKLRHSVVGLYDFVVHGMFDLTQDGNKFDFHQSAPEFYDEISAYFDKMIEKMGYNLNEIKLIEALLFASMIPLHNDNIKRQQMFYIKAVMKLNELFNKEEK